MEKLRGMPIRVRKQGMATPGSSQSISFRPDIIMAPTSTSAGAVAAVGMACTRGAKAMAARNSRPTTTLVRPVRPPAATPEALSM